MLAIKLFWHKEQFYSFELLALVIHSSLDCAYTLFVIPIPVLVFKASYIRGFLMYAGTVKYFVLFFFQRKKRGRPLAVATAWAIFTHHVPWEEEGREDEGAWYISTCVSEFLGASCNAISCSNSCPTNFYSGDPFA